ncbi:MAG: hypothetical protein MJZ38_04890 [archaeon]|nr:hypothetical protein [archaeon]
MLKMITMMNTNLNVRAGTDLISFLYNVPKAFQPYKVDGTAVSKITIEISVDGFDFYREEFRFCGGNPTREMGNIVVPGLGNGEYFYRVTETVVQFTSGIFGFTEIGTNSVSGSVTVGQLKDCELVTRSVHSVIGTRV